MPNHKKARQPFGRPLGRPEGEAHRCAESQTPRRSACPTDFRSHMFKTARSAAFIRLKRARSGGAPSTLPGEPVYYFFRLLINLDTLFLLSAVSLSSIHLFFGFSGGLGSEWIVRPVVAFVFSTQLFFDIVIGGLPEAV